MVVAVGLLASHHHVYSTALQRRAPIHLIYTGCSSLEGLDQNLLLQYVPQMTFFTSALLCCFAALYSVDHCVVCTHVQHCCQQHTAVATCCCQYTTLLSRHFGSVRTIAEDVSIRTTRNLTNTACKLRSLSLRIITTQLMMSNQKRVTEKRVDIRELPTPRWSPAVTFPNPNPLQQQQQQQQSDDTPRPTTAPAAVTATTAATATAAAIASSIGGNSGSGTSSPTVVQPLGLVPPPLPPPRLPERAAAEAAAYANTSVNTSANTSAKTSALAASSSSHGQLIDLGS